MRDDRACGERVVVRVAMDCHHSLARAQRKVPLTTTMRTMMMMMRSDFFPSRVLCRAGAGTLLLLPESSCLLACCWERLRASDAGVSE